MNHSTPSVADGSLSADDSIAYSFAITADSIKDYVLNGSHNSYIVGSTTYTPVRESRTPEQEAAEAYDRAMKGIGR